MPSISTFKIGLLLASLFTIGLCFNDNFPERMNIFPSAVPKQSLFQDFLKSSGYLLKNGMFTYAGTNGIYISNLEKREVLQAWFPGETIKAAFFDADNEIWWVGYTGFFRILDLTLQNVGLISLPSSDSALEIKEIKLFPDLKKVLIHLREKSYFYLYDKNSLTNSQPTLLDLNVNKDPIFYAQNGYLFYTNKDQNYYIGSAANGDKNLRVFESTVNHIKKAGNYLLIQTSKTPREYYIYDAKAPELVKKSRLIPVKATSDNARILSIDKYFLIVDGAIKEIYSVNDAGDAVLIKSNEDTEYFDEIEAFSQNTQRFFTTNSTSFAVQGYLFNGFSKETSYTFVSATANFFPETPSSNIYSISLNEGVYVGKNRICIVNFNTRKTVRTYTPFNKTKIQASYYLNDTSEMVVGYVGLIAFVNIQTNQIQVHDSISGLTDAVKEIHRVNLTVLLLHQRNKNNILYDFISKKVIGVFNSSMKSDRDPLFFDRKMVVYSSTSTYLEEFDLTDITISPVVWNHSYPGLAYATRVPGTNYIFIQSSGPNFEYFLFDILNWNKGEKIPFDTTIAGARIFAISPVENQINLIITSETVSNFYSVSSGKTTLQFSKIQDSFTDAWSIGLSSLKGYYLTTGGANIWMYESTYHSPVECLSLTSFQQASIFSEGIRSDIYLIRNSELETYVGGNQIFIIKFPTRVVRTIAPSINKPISCFYSTEHDLWILGYEKEVILVNLVTNQQKKIPSITGPVEKVYRVPGTSTIFIYQGNAASPSILYNINTDTPYNINPPFALQNPPYLDNNVAIFYSPGNLTAVVRNLSNPDESPRLFNHNLNPGILNIVGIKNTRFIAVQSVDRKVMIYDSYFLTFIKAVVTTFTSPIVFSPYESTLYLVQNNEYEAFKIDMASGLPSAPRKIKDLTINRVFTLNDQQGDFSDWFISTNGDDSVNLMSKTNDKIMSMSLVFRIEAKALKVVPNTNLIYYYLNDNSGKKNVFYEAGDNWKPLDDTESLFALSGKIIDIEISNRNATSMLILTDQKTYVWDRINKKIVAEFERSIKAVITGSQGDIVFYQSFADNNFKSFSWKQFKLLRTWINSNGVEIQELKALKSSIGSQLILTYVKQDVNYYYYRFNIDQDTIQTTHVGGNIDKNEASCPYFEQGPNYLYTCGSNSEKLYAYDPTLGKYDDVQSFKIQDFATRKIVSFHILDHPSYKKIVLLTKHKTDDDPLKVEVWNLVGNSAPAFASSFVMNDVKEGRIFLFGDQIRVVKSGFHFNIYKGIDGCPDGKTKLEVKNGDSASYCFNVCANKRLILSDNECDTNCPLNWDEENYLGLATNNKVCFARPSIDNELKPLQATNLALVFESVVRRAAFQESVCILAKILGWPNDRIQADGVRCSTSRVLQSAESPIGSLMNLEISPVLSGQRFPEDFIQSESLTLASKFNSAKSSSIPTLLSVQKPPALVQDQTAPADGTSIKIINTDYSFNGSAFNLTFNISHANLLVIFAWTDDTKNKTNPKFENLFYGEDGSGTNLLGTYRIITTKADQRVSVIFPRLTFLKKTYSFFAGAKVLNQNINSDVLRVNQTISLFAPQLPITYLFLLIIIFAFILN